MIVFLHGWGMNKSIFSQFVERYLSDEDVMLLDLPGYKEGEWVADFDVQVEQLMREIPEGSHLVAWSLAGLYALRITALYPNHLSRLTMVCSSPSFSQREGFSHALSPELLNQFSQQLLENREKTIERFLLLQLHGQPNAKAHARKIKERICLNDSVKQQVLEFGLQCLMNVDCRKELSECLIPVQFVLGERDMLVPKGAMKDIKNINPRIDIVLMPKVAHLPFVTHENKFFNCVFGVDR